MNNTRPHTHTPHARTWRAKKADAAPPDLDVSRRRTTTLRAACSRASCATACSSFQHALALATTAVASVSSPLVVLLSLLLLFFLSLSSLEWPAATGGDGDCDGDCEGGGDCDGAAGGCWDVFDTEGANAEYTVGSGWSCASCCDAETPRQCATRSTACLAREQHSVNAPCDGVHTRMNEHPPPTHHHPHTNTNTKTNERGSLQHGFFLRTSVQLAAQSRCRGWGCQTGQPSSSLRLPRSLAQPCTS